MANGNYPRGPKAPAVRAVPISMPVEINTPRSLLDEEREELNRILNETAGDHPSSNIIESMEGQAVYLVHSLPFNNDNGLKEYVGMKAKEAKFLMYFLHKAKWNIGRKKLDKKMGEKIERIKAVVGDGRLMVDTSYIGEAMKVADKIEEGMAKNGVRSVVNSVEHGVKLTPEFMKNIEMACKVGGRDLNVILGDYVRMVHDLMQKRGMPLTEENFRTALTRIVDNQGATERVNETQESECRNNVQQLEQIQRLAHVIPQGNYYGADMGREAQLLEDVLDDMRERIADTNDYLMRLGLKQKIYEQFKKSLNGKDVWYALAAANTYLAQDYMMRYVLWLLKKPPVEEI